MTGVSSKNGSIVDLSKGTPPAELSADVCVIGSGPGGATAAWRLASAGRDVLVLEEGGDRTGAELTQRDAEMYDQLYIERGGRATEDLAIAVMQGRALGGGAVINACDVVPITDEVVELWRTRFGLSELTPAVIEPSRRRALEDLSASRIDDAQLNLANRLLKKGAEALGLRGEVMMHNRVGCAGLGTCLIGCPMNAKKNPRFVAIPRAIEAGARFVLRARATAIHDPHGDTKVIDVRALDAKGYHETHALRVRAKHVIVAANAIGSAQLLLRSGIGTEHVGRNVMLQPQLPIIALFDEPVEAFRGIPQAYAVTEYETFDPERGIWGFRIEPVMGTPGIVSSMIPFTGAAVKELMTRYPNLAASLLLVPDEPSGQISVKKDGRPRIRYEHRENHRQRLRAAVKAAAKIYFAAGAARVIVPSLPPLVFTSPSALDAADQLTFEPVTAPLISAHQQGSVRFSTSPKTGGAAPDGQVWGTRGIWVFDSSGFPTSSSSHTMTPILTFAHHLADRFLAEH
ncbi:FAD-dependent oxidoreductase [Myxococcota bacterium]|nr:FAD-dependent oxidoreductase [Myxococcota bacterium]